MKLKFYTLIIVYQFFIIQNIIAQCNGYEELCDKKYDETAYLTTHNAYNAGEENFQLPNQTYGISQQLNDGVRGLMIDVYDEDGVPTVYHGFTFLGTVPLVENLTEIRNFLMDSPREIVTIILECYTTAAAIEQAMDEANLSDFLYEKMPDSDWATLREMIDTGKRLVVFTDVNDAGADQNWYHYVWDYAVETHYSVHDTAAFVCDYNRGNAANDLFIFNHFITDATFGTGQPEQAEIANANPFFINRINECQTIHNKFPNFITIDFYETGNILDVVNTLNGVMTTAIDMSHKDVANIFPNPANSEVIIEGINGGFEYVVYDTSGKVQQGGFAAQNVIRIMSLPKGIYFLNIHSASHLYSLKMVKR